MRVPTWLIGVLMWAAVIGLPALPTSHTVLIDVNDVAPNFFSPDVARVNLGDTVVFSLSHNHHTGAGHTVTSIAGPDAFDSGVIHWSYKWTPTVAGEYTYICDIHPYMKGIIAVGQEPSVTHAIVGENAANGVWPPDVTPLAPPTTPGVGEIWIDLQWFDKPGLPDEPGAVAVVDATTWQVTRVLPFGNNPHNLGASPDGRYVYRTSWHGDTVGIYDRQADQWIKTIDVGSAPAHVVTAPNGDAFVSLNAENFLAVLDPVTFAVKQHINFQGKGPHGVWLDIPSLSVVKTIEKVGKMLIQVPFTPDNKLAVQASTGDGGVIVIDAVHDEVLKRIKTHAGAHGVAIGDKAGGGWYAYVAHKYADVLTVIDMDTLEVAGEIKMPAAGGNGVAALPGAHLASELPIGGGW